MNDLEAILRTADARARRSGIRQLGQQGVERVGLLAEFLEIDPDSSVRVVAAEVLGNFDDDRAIDAVVLALQGDPSASVREASAGALGAEPMSPYRQASDGAVENKTRSLVKALSESDASVRRMAAVSLGRLGLDAAAPGLFNMLKHGSVEEREAAARSLMMLHGPSSQTAIIAGLGDDKYEIRLLTVRAIANCIREFSPERTWASWGWYRPTLRAGRLENDETTHAIVRTLSRLTRDPSADVRDAAVRALRALRSTLEYMRVKDYLRIIEDDEGVAVTVTRETPLSREEQMATSAMEEALGDEPAPRYADATFGWPIGLERVDQLAAGPLVVGTWIPLTVAVRVEPISKVDTPERRPIREVQQREPVTIYVTAEGDGFDIENPVATLILPPTGNSYRDAEFVVRPTRANDMPAIRVRLLYHFNLLEEIVVSAQVVGKFDDPRRMPYPSMRPVRIQQRRLEVAYLDLDRIQPREMHIDVGRNGEQFSFRFTFLNEAENTVEFLAAASLLATDLEDALVTVRRLWLELVYDDALVGGGPGDEQEFDNAVRKLARAGRDLWIALFRRQSDGALFEIGKWLEAHPLKDAALIQVSTDRDASHFVFPWALIFDRPLPGSRAEALDLDGFWGLRYRVEQHGTNRHSGDAPQKAHDGLKLAYLHWEHFPNSAKEIAMLRDLADRSNGCVEISDPPVSTSKAAYALLEEGSSDILYFFAHGYTRHRRADLGFDDSLDTFMEFYDKSEHHPALRKSLKPLYDSIKQGQFEPQRSWIELSYGKLYLTDLYERVTELAARPLVFLNMCESAQITPSLSDSFFSFFLDRGARVVIGTECPMTPRFAHAFAEQVLTDILSGAEVGVAILRARRHFIAQKNPLGLAYTAFGLSTLRYDPPGIGQ